MTGNEELLQRRLRPLMEERVRWRTSGRGGLVGGRVWASGWGGGRAGGARIYVGAGLLLMLLHPDVLTDALRAVPAPRLPVARGQKASLSAALLPGRLQSLLMSLMVHYNPTCMWHLFAASADGLSEEQQREKWDAVVVSSPVCSPVTFL